MTNDEKDQQAKDVAAQFGISMDQVYVDLDPREGGKRFIRVLSTVSKQGKACCAKCDPDGKNPGKTLWISFKRLGKPRLYSKVSG